MTSAFEENQLLDRAAEIETLLGTWQVLHQASFALLPVRLGCCRCRAIPKLSAGKTRIDRE